MHCLGPSWYIGILTFIHLFVCFVLFSGAVTTFAGQSSAGLVDGIASNARFYYPLGMDMDSRGYLYVADGGQFGGYGNNAIRYIKPSGT